MRIDGASVTESGVGVDSDIWMFCACTVIATEVAIMDSFELDDGPQAPSVSAKMDSKAVRI